MRDDNDRDYDDGRPFPVTVTIAGIGWIVFGGLILASLLILVAAAAAQRAPPGAEATSALWGISGCLGLFAAAFIFVGVQTVRGTAPGTVCNAVGSIIFALLQLASVGMAVVHREFLQAG